MRFTTFAASLSLLLVGCAGEEQPLPDRPAAPSAPGRPSLRIPSELAGIRGIVTAAERGSLRVEANPADESGSPKAVVRITPQTAVLYRNGDPADPLELTVGHNVSVWFAGPVMESYPVQGSAAAVVIEPAGIP